MNRLWKIVDLPFLGPKLILPFLIKKEGGTKESKGLRENTLKKYFVNVGMYSYGGCFERAFNTGGSVNIGRYCSFASNIHYFGANHPIKHVSTSPYFYNQTFGFKVEDIERKSLVIQNDVWCGTDVVITHNCEHIGNGAVIGAGSVVTKDVPAYAIVAGNPAEMLRYRFDSNTIDQMEKSKWWELPPARLMKHYQYIDKPFQFANRVILDREEKAEKSL